MPFEIEKTPLPGALLIKPQVFNDDRGHFLETYNQRDLETKGISTIFVQDNQSRSVKHVLRGFHFQAPPHAQAKLVRVTHGRALDVIIDLRSGSPTYGTVFSVELTGDNLLQLFVPEGFGHAFLTLEDNTIFQYKCSRFYNKESEGGICWNDPELGINWGVDNPAVSEKDQQLPRLKNFKTPFVYGR